ncbi:MAG TPA: DUF4190 domain-containing protein [Pyrinomonadaceae bacterium]|jgi:hypothetical protein
MKKCPVCDKTFEDSMRFCQTDGTPLVDVVEEAPEDPFKTMVARPEDDIASAIPPPVDPFKTMVAGSRPREESGDLLQLPEEYDPMKTSVVSPEEMRQQLGAIESKEDSAAGTAPPSPLESMDSPLELDLGESSNAFSEVPPELPKFSEPSLNPPDFGDMSSDASPQVPISSSPFSSEPSAPRNSFGDSPFNQSNEAPIPSPFGDPAKSFEPPPPVYKEPEPPTVLGGNPFDQSPSYGQQSPPVNQSFNPPAQQNEWAPPPAPVAGWQDQGLGPNTPFQPPAATQGQNQTLPIVSLILGIVSICCPIGVLTGPAAIITGLLGMKNVNNNPNQYGGKGLAIAGMIVGGLLFLLSVVWWILQIIGVGIGSLNRF